MMFYLTSHCLYGKLNDVEELLFGVNAGKQCVELSHQIEYINLQTYFTLNMIIGSDRYSCSRYSLRTKDYYFAVD